MGFDGPRIYLYRIAAFLTLSFWQFFFFFFFFFFHSRVWSSYNQLLLQFSIDSFDILHSCCGQNEDVHVDFKLLEN